MITRPKCYIEKCDNLALLVIAGKPICGDCYCKWYEERQKGFLNQLEEANAKN